MKIFTVNLVQEETRKQAAKRKKQPGKVLRWIKQVVKNARGS